MSESHAAGWASDAPTPAQLMKFFAQIKSGRVTKQRLQAFLRDRSTPTPSQEEVDECLDMHPHHFFSTERLRDAGIRSKQTITRVQDAVRELCLWDYARSGGTPHKFDEVYKIHIVMMRHFLLTYKSRHYFARVSNAGVASVDAMVQVIKRAGLSFEQGMSHQR